ncbi:MAG: CPBP family intramembrane metalloprotease [Planctomycetota bacterium]|nr:MAG: CPBP family intramembrane metalloprotease [Planctomycetota bacterium]
MAARSSKSTRPAAASEDHTSDAGGLSLSDFVTQGYFEASRRPLEILFFLLPLIALYEYELVRVLRSAEGLVTNGAHLAILRLFDAFGLDAVALSLPGFLLIAVFLVMHVLSRGPWIVDLSVVTRMVGESAALAIPLLVFAALVERMAPAAQVEDFASLDLGARIAVSIGAGLYEELVFRMALIALVIAICTDLLKMQKPVALVSAVAVSSLAFAMYHPLRGADGAVVPGRFLFFLAGGLYFGVLYVVRGFGIAAAAHAFFDIATALLIAPNDAA